jgi:hypothetical protein
VNGEMNIQTAALFVGGELRWRMESAVVTTTLGSCPMVSHSYTSISMDRLNAITRNSDDSPVQISS